MVTSYKRLIPHARRITMLLCLSMARMMFSPSISEGSGNGGLAAAGCGQDREGPLRVEGRLLLGHAGSGQVGPGAADKSLEGQHGCGSRIGGQAAPGVSGRQSATWRRGGETSRATYRLRH